MKKVLLWVLLLMLGWYAFWIANPASVNCENSWWELKIEKNADWSEYWVCYFTWWKQCEEWALFRWECTKGGVDVSWLGSWDRLCTIRWWKMLSWECALPNVEQKLAWWCFAQWTWSEVKCYKEQPIFVLTENMKKSLEKAFDKFLKKIDTLSTDEQLMAVDKLIKTIDKKITKYQWVKDQLSVKNLVVLEYYKSVAQKMFMVWESKSTQEVSSKQELIVNSLKEYFTKKWYTNQKIVTLLEKVKAKLIEMNKTELVSIIQYYIDSLSAQTVKMTAYLSNVVERDWKKYLKANEILWFAWDDAVAAFEKYDLTWCNALKLADNLDKCYPLNDYYIKNTGNTSEYEISSDVKIYTQTFTADVKPGNNLLVDFQTFKWAINDKLKVPYDWWVYTHNYESVPFHLELENNVIVKITEQFIP